MGMEKFDHKLIRPFFTEAVHLWGKVASFWTRSWPKGEVPTGVALTGTLGGDHVALGIVTTSPCSGAREPKVIVSMDGPPTLGPVNFASSQAGEYSFSNSVGSW